MSKNQQIGSEIEPPKDDDTLALIIQCPKCNTQRAFRVNDSFMLTITRKTSGCQYNVACSICGHQTNVQLIWTKRHLGWTVEKISFKKSIAVEDEFGLNPTKGTKEI
jgi:transcription elongation factor Elf1